jgi:hypothetical protein
VAGEAGDFVLLQASLMPTAAFTLAAKGALLLQPPPVFTFSLGFLPGTGELAVSGSFPDLGAGVEGITLFTQALVILASDGLVASSGQGLVLLDRSF